ncbi:tRNA (guanine(10)-N2)-methyltransferase [Zancudomyces culisetae]|uniref:tRNA (Guanine(10)-N2)-methyltransferase n=1 Tax=Zancudomyces culisetae TaxID=1213189 RepID=A0A1R1PWU6_ZANCU|nr:tRNA (guanine(10)-N2)-methyltransferase [Zancudomyces culisetae]|eukprot:OMH85456.1 tRNA (guanine(10)-N2)-methyltransferase [Zancudomyces culisetae]
MAEQISYIEQLEFLDFLNEPSSESNDQEQDAGAPKHTFAFNLKRPDVEFLLLVDYGLFNFKCNHKYKIKRAQRLLKQQQEGVEGVEGVEVERDNNNNNVMDNVNKTIQNISLSDASSTLTTDTSSSGTGSGTGTGTGTGGNKGDSKSELVPQQFYFGRLVALPSSITESTKNENENENDNKNSSIATGAGAGAGGMTLARKLISKFDVKQRPYIGTTSMDSEMSLIMANYALAAPGKLIYDPFVGTGSMLFTCSYFGAYTMGSDIDGRQIKGGSASTFVNTKAKRTNKNYKGGESTGLQLNIETYNLSSLVLGSFVADVTQLTFQCHNNTAADSVHKSNEGWFDAIVTDPPYGVRAGAKKIGMSQSEQDLQPQPESSRSADGYLVRYPTTIPYEMSRVIDDLVSFAARYLVLGGRLVFWLPTMTDYYADDDIPTHPCMKLLHNAEQSFGAWARRLITMEKVACYCCHSQHVGSNNAEDVVVPVDKKQTLTQDQDQNQDQNQGGDDDFINGRVQNEKQSSAAAAAAAAAALLGHSNFRHNYFNKPS